MNISEVLLTGTIAVASNEVDVNTIAFITQVRNSNTGNMEDVIYVATEFTKFGMITIEFNLRRSHPLVSTRLLKDFSVRGRVEFKTDNEYMKPGFISYVTGFSSGNYSYILFNERKISYAAYRSKITHMCRKDDALRTFLEIPITCKINAKTFNVLKAAQVFIPGRNLLTSLQVRFSDLKADDDVLVGLFSHSEDNSSALCIFTMPEVKNTALANMKACVDGITEFAAVEKYKNGLGCTKVNVVRDTSVLMNIIILIAFLKPKKLEVFYLFSLKCMTNETYFRPRKHYDRNMLKDNKHSLI
jgi:hypothetical protein